MSYTCPLNFVQVDSNASRLNSLMVASLVILYFITSNAFILYFLVIDFSIKLFLHKKYSLLSMLSLNIRKSLKLEEKFTDGGAKRLAGMFGLVFVSALVITHLLDLEFIALIVGVIFLACSLLDVFLNYCLGCQAYYIIKKIYPSFMS